MTHMSSEPVGWYFVSEKPLVGSIPNVAFSLGAERPHHWRSATPVFAEAALRRAPSPAPDVEACWVYGTPTGPDDDKLFLSPPASSEPVPERCSSCEGKGLALNANGGFMEDDLITGVWLDGETDLEDFT